MAKEYGKLEYSMYDEAAKELVNAMEKNGITYYISCALFGGGHTLHVAGMSDEKLKELYNNFVNAHLAVEDWAEERR